MTKSLKKIVLRYLQKFSNSERLIFNTQHSRRESTSESTDTSLRDSTTESTLSFLNKYSCKKYN